MCKKSNVVRSDSEKIKQDNEIKSDVGDVGAETGGGGTGHDKDLEGAPFRHTEKEQQSP